MDTPKPASPLDLSILVPVRQLTAEQRLAELAGLLAEGLRRLCLRFEQSHCSFAHDGAFGLDVFARQSVHVPASKPEVQHDP